MREYTELEEPPDSLRSNESVTGTVKAPTVYSPAIRGGNVIGSYLSLFE